MLEKSKLVIFDLDGTLYEGTTHFDYYAKLLEKNVAKIDQANFLDDYTKMKQGQHIVSIGKAYDVQRDLVLTVNPTTLELEAAHKWDGTVVNEVKNLYPSPLTFDFEHVVAIGDGWWLPFVAAKHYHVEDCYSSYIATKKFMVSEEFTLEQTQGLPTYLHQLREKTNIVLLTNSDREDVLRILHELGLNEIFSHIITSAQKPTKTTDWFKELLSLYEVSPEESISVGDNFINDIAPALMLGMEALYIAPYDQETKHKSLKQISSFSEIIGGC
jgi:putative hydrolase of the HAD superfamily